MKAIRQHRYGGPEVLVLENLPAPHPHARQVRIRVAAAGVQLLDTQIRSGLGPPRTRIPLPMTPGREVAGIVDTVGSEHDRSWLGKFVAADLGVGSGGYAELAIADVDRLHVLPAHLDPAEAVAAIGTGRTVQAILELAELGPTDSVLVTGASGGIGSTLVAAARRVTGQVIGLVTGTSNRAMVSALGATAVDSATPKWATTVRDSLGSGATVVLDGVGGELGAQAMSMLAVGGRLIMFGTASGTSIPLDADTVYRSGITVTAAVGARLLDRPGGLGDLEERSLAALIDHTLATPIGHRLRLEEAPLAHQILEQRRSHGKVVLIPAGG
nr:zinc-binding dehydrogenase [Microbacterium bovistercoris]